MSCNTTSTTIAPGQCINPIDWLLSKFTKEIGTGANKQTTTEQLDIYLDKGIVIPLCDFCCPCNGAPYTLSSVETFIKLAEAVGWTDGQYTPTTCCNTFNEDIQHLQECVYTGANNDILLDKGVVESGLINGESQLSKVIEWILNYAPNPKWEAFDRILDKGIVVYCETNITGGEGNLVIASVETFLKYYEAAQGQRAEEPCCENVYASVETYLKYNEAIFSDIQA